MIISCEESGFLTGKIPIFSNFFTISLATSFAPIHYDNKKIPIKSLQTLFDACVNPFFNLCNLWLYQSVKAPVSFPAVCFPVSFGKSVVMSISVVSAGLASRKTPPQPHSRLGLIKLFFRIIVPRSELTLERSEKMTPKHHLHVGPA